MNSETGRTMKPSDNAFSAPAVRVMNNEEIMKTIPHRYPFLLIDRLEVIEEEKLGVGIKCVTANEPVFQGHFPGKPVMPGVLVIEAMAQASAAMMMGAADKKGKLAFFMGIEHAKFRRPVVPGEVLRILIEVLRSGSRAGKVKGTAYVEDKLCAEAELTFAVLDK